MFKIWDIETFKCLKSIQAHSKSVSKLIQIKDGQLISGSCENKIKLWDIHLLKCLKIIYIPLNVVAILIQLQDNRLIVLSSKAYSSNVSSIILILKI